MFNVLVETKNEYTTHLINILTPLIFEGLQSVYKQSLSISNNNDILKIFQSFLKAIPKWNQVMIDTETNRIINSSHSYGWLNDLIKATLKANLIVLMYNPTCKSQAKITPELYQNIKTSDFIHKIYIECARELWNNPYLLYHNYPPIEIKRNQRDCMIIIKECIKESLRKLLPVKHILQIYLGEDMVIDNNDPHFDKAMTDAEERNLTKIIQKDLATDNNLEHPLELQFNQKSTDTPRLNNNDLVINPVLEKPNIGQTNTEEKTIGSRILNIINNPTNIEQQVIPEENKANTITSPDSDLLNSSTIKKESIISPKRHTETKEETIEDKIKKVLQRDLATDSDLETSLNYSQEDNDNRYQEIFSNSVITPNKNKQSVDIKNKKKFFNNYLQF
jgi:hypothetical protein